LAACASRIPVIQRRQHRESRLRVHFLANAIPDALPQILMHAQQVGQFAAGGHGVRRRALHHRVDHAGFVA
jgi:hypothetical protein